jgi:predicted nucleic-acid-binding Zn-ribbon protein
MRRHLEAQSAKESYGISTVDGDLNKLWMGKRKGIIQILLCPTTGHWRLRHHFMDWMSCNSIFREHEKNVRRNLVTPENSVSISNRQNRRFINSFLLCSECTYQNNFFRRKRKKYVLPNPAINEKHSIIYSLKESILDLYNNRGKGSSALHRVLKLHRVAFCASSSHKCRYARVYSEERQVLPNDGVIFPCFQIHLW